MLTYYSHRQKCYFWKPEEDVHAGVFAKEEDEDDEEEEAAAAEGAVEAERPAGAGGPDVAEVPAARVFDGPRPSLLRNVSLRHVRRVTAATSPSPATSRPPPPAADDSLSAGSKPGETAAPPPEPMRICIRLPPSPFLTPAMAPAASAPAARHSPASIARAGAPQAVLFSLVSFRLV